MVETIQTILIIVNHCLDTIKAMSQLLIVVLILATNVMIITLVSIVLMLITMRDA